MRYLNHEWRVACILKVGQRGTLKPYNRFGDDLVCVRYRYKGNYRIKTAEIVLTVARIKNDPEDES